MSFAIGNKGELLVKEFFEKYGYEVDKVGKADRELYDLTIKKNDVKRTVEIKYDFKSLFTGNLAIEFYNSHSVKNSGINISGADFWIYVVPMKDAEGRIINELWLCPRNVIFSFVQSKPGKIKNDVGDGNACIYLYRKEELLGPVFKCISYMSVEQIDKEI